MFAVVSATRGRRDPVGNGNNVELIHRFEVLCGKIKRTDTT
jgi:hypothetical protein